MNLVGHPNLPPRRRSYSQSAAAKEFAALALPPMNKLRMTYINRYLSS
jgi:hypothetical protein